MKTAMHVAALAFALVAAYGASTNATPTPQPSFPGGPMPACPLDNPCGKPL